ncbi:hypothetical protein ES332_A04G163100v1 [Gossypium tomentosum]|uniref:Uncharacterized protein n=1 Tax=Gossypium tomentosum TaxID=34277 RepID=A0A5D2QYY9_GOSTO|nr:hypothetical protein ES332_A04G163100v1 [Gossypium tomentosum]
MFLDEVLVGEVGSVYRFTSGAVSSCEVTSLAHKIRDHTVELRAFVVEWFTGTTHAFLAGTECTEVLGSARGNIGKKLHHDPTSRFASDRHVKEYFRIGNHC